MFAGLQTLGSLSKSSGFSWSQRALVSCQYVKHNATENVILQEYKTWSGAISSGTFPSVRKIPGNVHSAAAAVFQGQCPISPHACPKRIQVFSSGTSCLFAFWSDCTSRKWSPDTEKSIYFHDWHVRVFLGLRVFCGFFSFGSLTDASLVSVKDLNNINKQSLCSKKSFF